MKTREEGKSHRAAAAALHPLGDDELTAVSGAGAIHLSYGAIEWTYTKQKPDGTAAGDVAAS